MRSLITFCPRIPAEPWILRGDVELIHSHKDAPQIRRRCYHVALWTEFFCAQRV